MHQIIRTIAIALIPILTLIGISRMEISVQIVSEDYTTSSTLINANRDIYTIVEKCNAAGGNYRFFQEGDRINETCEAPEREIDLNIIK